MTWRRPVTGTVAQATAAARTVVTSATRPARVLVTVTGVREPSVNRGWPETGARRSFYRGPRGRRPPWVARDRRASLICSGGREAGAHRGWPETGARRSLCLLERAPRLVLDQRPDALDRRGELGLPQERLDARPVELDRHRRQHTPGPAREDDDAVREVHGLLAVVRAVEERLPGATPGGEMLLM